MLRQLFHSATFNTWISLAVRIGGLALLLPLALRHFDVQEVLVWQLQSSIVAMLMWIDFGMTPTFSRFIAVARGGGTLGQLLRGNVAGVDPELAARPVTLGGVTGTLRRINAIMAVLGSILVLIIGTLVIQGPIAGLHDPATGWLAWVLTALAVPVSLLNGSNTAVLVGMDRITPLRRVESLIGFVQIMTTCVAVVTTDSLAAVAGNYTLWGIVLFAVNRWMAGRALAENGARPSVYDPALFRAAWAAGWRSGIGILFSTGLIQGSGMVMPQIAPPEVAAAYLIVLRIMTLSSQLAQAPFYTRLPAMAKANAEGRRADVVKLATGGMRVALWTLLAGIAALVFVAPLALELIGSSVHIPDQRLSMLLGVAFFAERYGAMHMQIYTLSNHVIWHRVNGLTGVIGVVAFVLLWPLVGPVAVPLGMVIGYAGFLCPYISIKSLKFLGLNRWPFERATSILPLLALLGGVSALLTMQAIAQ